MITKNFLLISNRNYSAFKKSLGVSLIWIYSEPLIMFLVLGYGIGALIDRIEGGSYLKFITPGFIFGEKGKRYIRISLCSKPELLMETIQRIKRLSL